MFRYQLQLLAREQLNVEITKPYTLCQCKIL